MARAAEEYGYHLGLAYQIIDDVLDFTSASDELGKPAMADVSLGLSTAPVLYAAEGIPEMRPMIKRKFKQEGDVERTLRFVLQSDGIDRSRGLALFHAQRAVNAMCRYCFVCGCARYVPRNACVVPMCHAESRFLERGGARAPALDVERSRCSSDQ